MKNKLKYKTKSIINAAYAYIGNVFFLGISITRVISKSSLEYQWNLHSPLS